MGPWPWGLRWIDVPFGMLMCLPWKLCGHGVDVPFGDLMGLRAPARTFTLHLFERKSKPCFDDHVIGPRFIFQDTSKVENCLTDEETQQAVWCTKQWFSPFSKLFFDFYSFHQSSRAETGKSAIFISLATAIHDVSWCIHVHSQTWQWRLILRDVVKHESVAVVVNLMKEQALKPALVGCFNRLVAFPALDGTWQLNRLFVYGGFIM